MIIRKGFIDIAIKQLAHGKILWLLRQALNYSALKKSLSRNDGTTSAGPIIAHFFCTARCNLQCPMCDIPHRYGNSELSTEQARFIIDECVKNGISGISFTGGEPLLRKDIFDLLRYSRSRGLQTILVTNGIELEHHVDSLIQARPSVINISIDGSCPEIHDISRGVPGSFERTMSGLHILTDMIRRTHADIQVVASTVISQNNINDLDALISLCRARHIDRIIFCPLHLFSKGSSSVAAIHTTLDIGYFLSHHNYRSMIDNSDYYLNAINSVIHGTPPPSGCTAGYTTIIIDAYGRIYPCKCYFETERPISGPLSPALPLSAVLKSDDYSKFRKQCATCTECFMTVNREFDRLFK